MTLTSVRTNQDNKLAGQTVPMFAGQGATESDGVRYDLEPIFRADMNDHKQPIIYELQMPNSVSEAAQPQGLNRSGLIGGCFV
jgi:hypothetical protein